MRLFQILSRLLDYPDAELYGKLPELHAITADFEPVIAHERERLLRFIDWAQTLPLLRLQETYVKTFDLTPDHALYLTHHLFEEQDRQRGPVLAELSEFFATEGLQIERGELPDYLPLVLEYAATLADALSARAFLAQASQVAGLLAERLEKTASPYASLLRIVEDQGLLAGLADVPACGRQGSVHDLA